MQQLLSFSAEAPESGAVGIVNGVTDVNDEPQLVCLIEAQKKVECACEEEAIFMPARTLPRTPPPQPLTLPPCQEVTEFF